MDDKQVKEKIAKSKADPEVESAKTPKRTKAKSKPVIRARDLAPRPDLFQVYNKEPGFKYYHAKDDPLRIRQLEIDGYEVCNGAEVIGSPIAIQSRPESGPLNLPGHVLMKTSEANAARLDDLKDQRLKQHEQDLKDTYDQVEAVLKRAGLGRAKPSLKDEEIEF